MKFSLLLILFIFSSWTWARSGQFVIKGVQVDYFEQKNKTKYVFDGLFSDLEKLDLSMRFNAEGDQEEELIEFDDEEIRAELDSYIEEYQKLENHLQLIVSEDFKNIELIDSCKGKSQLLPAQVDGFQFMGRFKVNNISLAGDSVNSILDQLSNIMGGELGALILAFAQYIERIEVKHGEYTCEIDGDFMRCSQSVNIVLDIKDADELLAFSL